MSFGNGPRIVTNGLVLSLDASDKNSYPGSGTTWTDLSGNNKNSTLTGTPSFDSNYNGGITFFNSSTYSYTNLTVPSPSTTATTYEVAFIPSGSTLNYSGLMGSSGYLNDGFSLGIQSNYIVSQGYSGSSNFYDAFTIPSFSSINMLTVVYQSRQNTYYMNGALISNSTYTFDVVASSTPIRIGGYSQGGWDQSRCTLFYARVYNRALSADEIIQNYNAQKSRFNLR